MIGWPTTWLEEAGNQLWGMLDAFRGEASRQGYLTLLRPVAPFNRPDFMAPAVTVGALFSMLLLSGIAVASLGALLTALIALYLLLVQVFGVTVELHPFGSSR
jgi:hypothetical protein